MKTNRCKSLFCSFKQVLKNIKNHSNKHAFTLLEVIVAIIIIGALLAFALPKYETALDKSRFSTLMPITKSIKDAEEIFYVASNQYTADIQSLDVKTHPGETVQISVVDDDDYSYVQAIDPRIDNIYKAYLKHSTNFAEERHCEALSDSSRAKKVCENLGGTEVGENGNYIAYSLDSNGGHGTFEKDCEDAQPDTEQTCASGCGTQTRTVTCNRRTGTWETGDFEGDCPEQGETSQSCTNGVGTETRTFTCQGNTWVAGEWDTSSCTCDPEEKPKETQTCTTGVGTETRSVTCNGTTWETGNWDTSSCTCDENTKPDASRSCQVGTGTETREVTCDGTSWSTGEWDTSDCGCDPETEPSTEQTCSDGCQTGTQTRDTACENGAWTAGEWSVCSVTKPEAASYSCSGKTANGYYYTGGTYTRAYSCSNGSWKLSSTYDYSGCTGGCNSSAEPASSMACTSYSSSYTGGTATRSVTCNNGLWRTGSWSTGWCCTTAKPDPLVVDNCTYYYYCDYGTWRKPMYCELPGIGG